MKNKLKPKIKSKKLKKSSKKSISSYSNLPIIKVVGIGGGGGNVISRMSREFIRGVDFIAINTDHQDLDHCNVRHKIYIGKNLTRGLGTGMNPELGRQAVEENRAEVAEALKGADMVFLAAGLGGGTGSGGLPIIAEVAKQNGALTLAFVTKPFTFEGAQRAKIAEEAIMRVKDKVDVLVVISNDKIFSLIHKDTPLLKAFGAIDDILKNAILGIVEIIAVPGIINLDFADIKSIVQDAGTAVVGVGIGSGQNRASLVVEKAMNSPLFDLSPENAKGIIFSVAGTKDMKMSEIYDVANKITEAADHNAKIIFGTYYDRHLKPGQLKVTLIATGLNSGSASTSLFSLERTKASFNFELKSINEGQIDIKPDQATPLKSGLNKNIFSSQKEKHNLKDDNQNDKNQKDEANKKLKEEELSNNDDIWEIPTFLRKKKR